MFFKKPAKMAEQAQVRHMTDMNSRSTFSVIGTDVTIKGDIEATADLHIDGAVEGDIKCSSLVQGESGSVVGSIVAESARLAGKVNGSIRVRELVVRREAHIHGDVQYEALTIEQGAQVDGRFAHGTKANEAAIVANELVHAVSDAEVNSEGEEPKLGLVR